MAQNVNSIEVLELTPEVKEMLKKNYFFVNKAKFPSFFASSVLMAYLFVGIAIFVIFYFEPVLMTYIFASILIVVAFFYTFKWVQPYYKQKQKFSLRPTHDQIENWFVKDIKNIVKPAAIQMLSLNPATITHDNFIIIPHPVWWHIESVPDEHIARQNTGEYNIYATYNIQVLALSQNYISFYNCTYDWLNNQIVKPYTLEFFFEDISSIRAEDKILEQIPIDYEPPKLGDEDALDEEKKEEPPKIGVAQTVIVKNKSGEAMEVIVNIPTLSSSPRTTLRPEKVMQTLRIMLRHRRFGEEFELQKDETENSEEKEE